MALSWTHSNRSMSFLCQGPQTTSSQINSCFTYVLSEALHKPVYLNYSLFTIKLFTIHYLNTEIQLIINTRIWQWEELHDYKALRNSKCFSYVTIKKKIHTLYGFTLVKGLRKQFHHSVRLFFYTVKRFSCPNWDNTQNLDILNSVWFIQKEKKNQLLIVKCCTPNCRNHTSRQPDNHNHSFLSWKKTTETNIYCLFHTKSSTWETSTFWLFFIFWFCFSLFCFL